MAKQTNFFNLDEEELKRVIKMLTNIAISRLRDEHHANDAVQQTLEKAIKNKRTFRGGNLDAWLTTILKNNIYDFLTGRRAREDELTEFNEPKEEAFYNQDLEDTNTLEKKIKECFWSLKEIDREIMGYVQNEESYSFISNATKLSKDNVAKRVCEARKKLKECIDNCIEI